MKVVMLEVPEKMLAERRRLGLDGRDEMWDGVLHILVPPAGGPHQRLNARLSARLTLIAEGTGLEPHVESGLFRDESDYRVPDQLYCRPEHTSARGAEGAELVVEIRSPGDETYDKLDFYGALGVREVLVVHPTERRVEVFRAIGDTGRLLQVQAGADGMLALESLGVRFRSGDGVLHLSWDGGSADL